MQNQSFKQYIEGKRQLLQAVENTPTAVLEYEVKKYCSLTVGETEDDKELIGLKPRHKLVVEWRYDDPSAPTPEAIQVIGAKDIDIDDRFNTFWTGSKLQRWLTRHTTQGNNNGYRT